MPNTWVKNVYSLGMTPWITLGKVSTIRHNVVLAAEQHGDNHRLIQRITHWFSLQLSTPENQQINLLIDRLYTQSTAPINRREKEKERK